MTLRLFGTASLAAIAAMTTAMPAMAQDRPAEPASDDIVVTAQAQNQTQVIRGGQLGILGDKPASDVPFNIRSYDSTLILNQQPQTLGQLLENDPAVRTTYGFGNAAELFVIRGFPLFSDDIGMDGLYGITPRQLVAPELYDQVQVLNGASAFLNGAAPGGTGIGGSVNLIPKRAGAKPLTRATANYTADGHFGGAVDVARRFADGAVGVRLNGAYRAGDVAVDGEFRRTAVAGGAIDYDGGNLRLMLDGAYQKVRVDRLRPKVTIASTAIPRVPDAKANYAQDFTYSTLRDVFGTARLEYDLAPNALFYAMAGARDGSEDGIYGGITVTDAATGAGTGNALYVPRTDNNEAVQAGVRVKLAAGGITHEFNVGGNRSWQVNRNAYDFRYGPGFAGFATNLYATPQVALPSSTLVGGDLDDPFPIARSRLGSMFASDTIGIAGDRVLVTGGLRLQTLSYRSYSYADGSLSSGYSKDAVTPVAGLVVKPVDGVSLFANRIESLAQGPVAPTTGFDPTTGATLPVINASETLSPYRSVQYEAGGKLAVGRFNASISVFSTARPIGQVSADAAAPGFVRFGFFGEQRHRGVELSVDGELTRGLRLIAGGSYIDARLRDTIDPATEGNRAPGVPAWLANANAEWDLPFLRGLTLTGRVVYTGEQQVNVANTLEIPAWTRFDVGARFVASVAETPVTLRVNVDNVGNKRYWASSFDSFNQALLQGLPRTYKASVTVDF
ncbi:TonB-dependent receptor [Sphingomonas sp. KR1UV-12]|uniref:TonB-dependent receptor n=1 Tax=Sphingomonas aurea TaxID=3063994 RepID=A0ABT9ENR9_9SPHN|nr:TonB-dependent receptor [Sphingomonas sp. KR1UV-12]MDP1028596.1 TonB-dependent receptor [Sphingomonas sp. KR1UV-12]